ncbi:MAG: Hsp70 family protein [Deltaproteobacteria bacterium]|nr:Hsp70 family protein [Deltaproteobacteria bacterium]
MEPRFSVGIDLGTTNSALAEVDLAVQPAGPGEPLPGALPFAVTQVFAPGEVGQSDLLPSFVYLPSPHEAPPGALGLPWEPQRTHVVGQYARDRGAQVPARLVSSAKSWLSHPGVDKRGALLPPKLPGDAPDDVPRISPVEASARILSHLREAWEAAHHDDFEGPLKLADQAVTLTVPASFDPEARELTVAAAAQAGIPKLTLLEEPQAALYAWVQALGDEWRARVQPGDIILVVDVGGGTSDFSLIGVREESGSLALERLAVGDHILLGGDNLDLALAHTVNARLAQAGTKLDAWQFAALTFACRKAKESPHTAQDGSIPITLAGRGSSLLGGLIRTELKLTELRQVADAFFPEVALDTPLLAARRAGLTTLGLPYAQDPAVTRQLAAFLRKHQHRPTALLFNGGVFKDEALRARVGDLVDSWMQKAGGAPLKRLSSGGPFDALDLGVALGAAYSGLARRGRGIRIRGGLPRAYYVGVESAAPAVPGFDPPMKAVCLAPFGLEEGTQIDLPQLDLGAVIGERARFRFFSSDQRRDDTPGAIVDDVHELTELPEIEAHLPADAGHVHDSVIPVGLRAAITEVGTLALHLVSRQGPPTEWKLEFSVREAT